jgi:DNA modification methylase
MPHLADSSIDLIVTSPPYWVDPGDTYLGPALLAAQGGGTPQTYPDFLGSLRRCFAECHRVLKPGRFCAVNVAPTLVQGRLCPLPFHLVGLLEEVGLVLHQDLVWRRWRGWDKRAGHLVRRPYPGYFFPNRVLEYVLIFAKPGGTPMYLNRTQRERERSRIPTQGELFTHEIANNLWNILPVPPKTSAHPCPFPEELAHRLVTLYSYAGETVLDPFLGSGTTAKVAKLTGRGYVGYEPNLVFLQLARERLRETVLHRQRRVCRFETLPEPDHH